MRCYRPWWIGRSKESCEISNGKEAINLQEYTMEKIVLDIPSFIGTSKQALEEKFGKPDRVVRISYIEEDWEIVPTPFGYYREVVNEAVYNRLIRTDEFELRNSSLSFHIGTNSDLVKGISVILESDKFIYDPQKIMQIFGMSDAGEPDEGLTQISNWWNYRGWTVNLHTIDGNFVTLMVYPSQLLDSAPPE